MCESAAYILKEDGMERIMDNVVSVDPFEGKVYLTDLLGEQKTKAKGAIHINGATDDDILYLENQTCDTIEVKRIIDNPNRFTYNVYLKTI